MRLSPPVTLLGLAAWQAVASPVTDAESTPSAASASSTGDVPVSPALQAACCSALSSDNTLKGKVLFPKDAGYEALLDSYYSANAALPAWCIVRPESTADVSQFAKIINQKQCPFGIRSGGHSAFKDSNGIQNGVTVDFSYMNTTTYNPTTKIASIQPGSRWGAVYEALQPYGVTAAGGRASVVGVGGFTTGAGYTFHSNRYGFACDMVQNWEIVLANGTVVNANAKQNADLWKAQKGGSGNLGFVTRIDQFAIPSTNIWGGFVSYDLSLRAQVFDAYVKFAEAMGNDPASQEIAALYYDSTGYSLRSILTNSDAIPNAAAFNQFLQIANTSSTIATAPMAEFVPQFTGPTPLGLYANWFTGMTTNDARVMELFYQKIQEYATKMAAAAPGSDFNILIEFQPVPPSFVAQSVAKGGNMLGLEPLVKADGPLLMWLIALTVDTEANQQKILPLGIQFRDDINKQTTSMGVNTNWIYLNYAYGDQNPMSQYGKTNINFMKAASAKYDPKGNFQKLRKTGFKLPN
ncbi:hypothetical protein BGZ63DRAFT_415561 [Mariannaea sp. PMI_226]|nr:hypothetical protein BGZ63DRAFT_415561 [Mariannaea sp. PMI_226]